MYLKKVEQFMVTFDQPVLDAPIAIPEDRNKLRINLIFEELKEYAEASGQIYYFEELCEKFCLWSHNMTQVHPHPTSVNQVEQLDALLDLQYVLSGAVHEHGFGKIFDEAFEEVHNSNMSKACNNLEEAEETRQHYETTENTESIIIVGGGIYLVKRKSDEKVLKSINYKPAQLEQFLK